MRPVYCFLMYMYNNRDRLPWKDHYQHPDRRTAGPPCCSVALNIKLFCVKYSHPSVPIPMKNMYVLYAKIYKIVAADIYIAKISVFRSRYHKLWVVILLLPNPCAIGDPYSCYMAAQYHYCNPSLATPKPQTFPRPGYFQHRQQGPALTHPVTAESYSQRKKYLAKTRKIQCV